MSRLPLTLLTKDYDYLGRLAAGDVAAEGIDLTFVRSTETAHVLAQAGHAPLPPERLQLLRSLVPYAVPSPTALDAALTRLVVAQARRDTTPDLAEATALEAVRRAVGRPGPWRRGASSSPRLRPVGYRRRGAPGSRIEPPLRTAGTPIAAEKVEAPVWCLGGARPGRMGEAQCTQDKEPPRCSRRSSFSRPPRN